MALTWTTSLYVCVLLSFQTTATILAPERMVSGVTVRSSGAQGQLHTFFAPRDRMVKNMRLGATLFGTKFWL